MKLLPDDRKIDLGVATEAKIVVARNEHFLMDRAVHLVTGRATFTDRFVFPNKRTALFFVAFKTSFVNILKRRGRPGPDVFAVRAVAIGAIHLPLENGMMKRLAKFHFFIQVADKTGLRIFMRIDDVADPAALLHMKARRSVTHLASLNLHFFMRNADARVGGPLEFLHLLFVAGAAGFGSHKRCALDAGNPLERKRGSLLRFIGRGGAGEDPEKKEKR